MLESILAFDPTFWNIVRILGAGYFLGIYASQWFRNNMGYCKIPIPGFDQFSFVFGSLILADTVGTNRAALIAVIVYFLADRSRWAALRRIFLSAEKSLGAVKEDDLPSTPM